MRGAAAIVDKANEYRAHAAECMRLAAAAKWSRDKYALTEMARMWIRLAELAEKNSRADVVYETPPPRPIGDEAE